MRINVTEEKRKLNGKNGDYQKRLHKKQRVILIGTIVHNFMLIVWTTYWH